MTTTNHKEKRIIFLGTPDFAVASLDALMKNGFNVVAVVTVPDKAAGRGQKIHESDVKKYAVEHNIPVLQPKSLKSPKFISTLQSYKADLQVVVAFRMLPEIVWNMPPMGTLNVHGSLLPQYRGAAPINWAIIKGEKHTGVTTFLLKHEIDTGKILGQKIVEIQNDDDFGSMYEKLKHTGAELLVESVNAYFDNDVEIIDQDESKVSHAPKIFKDMCEIDFNQSCTAVRNFIRGLAPKPAAYTFIQNKMYKILKAEIILTEHNDNIGALVSDGKSHLRFACTDGYLDVKLGQLEGKKAMSPEDFLRGYKFN